MKRLMLVAGWLLGSGSMVFAQSAPLQPGGIKLGYEVFHHWCVDCHGVGDGAGTRALNRQYHGAISGPLEERTDLSPALVRLAVRRGIEFMPFFRKTEITDRQLAALCAYLSGESTLRQSAVAQEQAQWNAVLAYRRPSHRASREQR